MLIFSDLICDYTDPELQDGITGNTGADLLEQLDQLDPSSIEQNDANIRKNPSTSKDTCVTPMTGCTHEPSTSKDTRVTPMTGCTHATRRDNLKSKLEQFKFRDAENIAPSRDRKYNHHFIVMM